MKYALLKIYRDGASFVADLEQDKSPNTAWTTIRRRAFRYYNKFRPIDVPPDQKFPLAT